MSFQLIAVSHRLGSTELKAYLLDPPTKRVSQVVVQWSDVDGTFVPPTTWSEAAKAEAGETSAASGLERLMRRRAL